MSFPNELTLEQQFQYRRMQDESQKLTREHAVELLLELTRMAMVKDNLIKSLEGKTNGSSK